MITRLAMTNELLRRVVPALIHMGRPYGLALGALPALAVVERIVTATSPALVGFKDLPHRNQIFGWLLVRVQPEEQNTRSAMTIRRRSKIDSWFIPEIELCLRATAYGPSDQAMIR
jgi:hypothetical protein